MVLTQTAGVDALLRSWRERRRFSQQELSNRSNVSTRHISRVETGLARPTPDMILRLSDSLDLPLRERNRLLLAGGYAPRFPEHELDHASLAVIMYGLRHLLDAHLPYPALLLDDYWDIVDANTAVDALLAGCAAELLDPPINVLRLSLHPEGLAPRIRNFPQWAAHLRGQVVHRAERTQDPRHLDLVTEIDSYAGQAIAESATGPVISLDLEVDGDVLRFFSVSAVLDAAADSGLEGVHLETFLPADAATRDALNIPVQKESSNAVSPGHD